MGTEISGSTGIDKIQNNAVDIADLSATGTPGTNFLRGDNTWAATPITALNNATENELVTVGATTTELDAEANLTFDGTDLTLGTGDIVFGTAGKGICLGATTNTDANTLDDYEEGTWTPEIRDLGGNSATLSITSGTYTKIGRWVQINFKITLSSKGSMTGNYVLMGGLPFNHPTESYNGTGVIDYWGNFAYSYSGLWFDTSSTASRMWLNAVPASGSTSTVMPTVAAINNNSYMKGSCMYQISV